MSTNFVAPKARRVVSPFGPSTRLGRWKPTGRRATEGHQVAVNNGWQGVIPTLKQQGASIIVKDDIEQDELVSGGYVRVGDCGEDHHETTRGPDRA